MKHIVANLPFQRELTVIVERPPQMPAQADADVTAIKKGGTVWRTGAEDELDLYVNQLRLRVAHDPTLEKRIVVFVVQPDGQARELPLLNVTRWPPGYQNAAWDIEMSINALVQRRKGDDLSERAVKECEEIDRKYSDAIAEGEATDAEDESHLRRELALRIQLCGDKSVQDTWAAFEKYLPEARGGFYSGHHTVAPKPFPEGGTTPTKREPRRPGSER